METKSYKIIQSKPPYLYTLIFVTLFNTCSAKSILPAEILGRDLNYPGLGWLGHVGIAITDTPSIDGMLQPANQVIEVLNETPVGQINSIDNFKIRSNYWGSKYGISDNSEQSYRIIVEANHQRWWCPSYTSDTKYHIGRGDPRTGAVKECARWRCDTFVWWAFYSQGFDLMPGRTWLPRILFNAFPYYNDESEHAHRSAQIKPSDTKPLNEYTTQELNQLDYDEFAASIATHPRNYISLPSIDTEIKLAADEDLDDIKRTIIIDRLTSQGTAPNLIPDLIKIYSTTSNSNIKRKIAEGLMLYNQQHIDDAMYTNDDKTQLKQFFYEQLEGDEHSPKATDSILRGFIDTHAPEEIIDKVSRLDPLLAKVGNYSSIMLKYSLIHKSKALQQIYLPSIIHELCEANNPDLDSYLFGPLSIGYKASGQTLLEPEAKALVISYLERVRYKYTATGISNDGHDSHRAATAPYYHELTKVMGITQDHTT